MIKRTIEISGEPAHLCVEHGQLLVLRDGERKRDVRGRARIPCEDVGFVVVDERQTTYSHTALATLAGAGAVVVVCGSDHLPCGLLLPLGSHPEIVQRYRLQSGVRAPLRKRLWSAIVAAKVRAQAANLIHAPAERRRLLELARRVRSGDPENVEAQAARCYWGSWLTDPDLQRRFRRLPGDPAAPSPNNLLDYGYTILRAAVARAIVSAGLCPVLGIQHSHRANAFSLADDLIEPLRPIIDRRVQRLALERRLGLGQPTKAELLLSLTARVRVNDLEGPLMVGLHRYVASFVWSLETGQPTLEIPVEAGESDEC